MEGGPPSPLEFHERLCFCHFSDVSMLLPSVYILHLEFYIFFQRFLFRHEKTIFVMYSWNPNDPCFDWKVPCFGGLKPKNRGQIGSRLL